MIKVILASTSPRRRELLSLLGIAFEVVPPKCKEVPSPTLSPCEQAKQFAEEKAQSIAIDYPEALILGGDTIVEIDGKLLGKPSNFQEAETMLQQLRGRCHQVHTGVAFIQKVTNFSMAFVETALVWVKHFNKTELLRYQNTGESLDKAGAYSIQGEGAQFISKIEGDYSVIVGLPLWHTATLLEKQGVVLSNPVEEIYRLKSYNNWKNFS